MAYYKTCPHCGAALDPGEVCDCRSHGAATQEIRSKTDNNHGELNGVHADSSGTK